MRLVNEVRCNFHPMSVRFNPYLEHDIISATADNFGLKGRGQLVSSSGTVIDFNDSLFDACFSDANQVLTACGDGFIYHVDMSSPHIKCRAPAGHTKECVSVDCNSQLIASAGWDGCVLLFNRQLRLIQKVDQLHRSCHRVIFHPSNDHLLLSCGGDGMVKILDARQRKVVNQISTNGHVDVLSVDWNKYEQSLIASGSADGLLRIFDMRYNTQIAMFKAHRRAVKQLQFSPFSSDQLATASYDMSVAVWDWKSNVRLSSNDGFSEFVSGLDWSVHQKNRLAVSCWDQTVREFVLF